MRLHEGHDVASKCAIRAFTTNFPSPCRPLPLTARGWRSSGWWRWWWAQPASRAGQVRLVSSRRRSRSGNNGGFVAWKRLSCRPPAHASLFRAPSRPSGASDDGPGMLRSHCARTLEALVRASLRRRAFNDITTIATVVSDRRARRSLRAQAGVICGVPLAVGGVPAARPGVHAHRSRRWHAREPGEPVLFVTGHARGLLSSERVALNFMQRLSAIATLTAQYVEAVRGTNAKILDTRKTTPGWRPLEKYAVRAGGGTNHRMDLSTGVLIKDNHLAALDGDVAKAVIRARELAPKGIKIEVECDSVEQVIRAADAAADIICSTTCHARSGGTFASYAAAQFSKPGRRDAIHRAGIAETGVD